MFDSNSTLARLRCCDPAALINLGFEVVLKHILATGSTGSGKTSSLIDPCIAQFMRFACDCPQRRLGLLILDPKADSVSKVLACAEAAKRRQDVVILGQDFHYDLFAGLVSLDQVDHFVKLLMSGTADMGPYNAYFEEARHGLLASSICLLLANGGPISFLEGVDFLAACWFSQQHNKLLEDKLRFAKALLNVGRLTEATRRRLQLAVLDVEQFSRLEPRLRETHRSSILNVIRPLLNPAAQRLFSGQGRPFLPGAVLDGRILLASLNAQVHPELASLVFRLVKRDFFRAIHARGAAHPQRDRFCLLVVDEYYLAAEPEDVENLATCRSRGAGVLAATQGLSALDEKLGRRKRDALLANFGSMFFFSNRERATDEEAFLRLGYQDPDAPSSRIPGFGRITVVDPLDLPCKERICELGALSRLIAHEAFVSLSDGTRTPSPVCLEPTFHPIPEPANPAHEPDDLAREVERLKSALTGESATGLSSDGHLLVQMHQDGRRLWLTPGIVSALWRLCEPMEPREELVRILEAMGISVGDKVPGCWLAGLGALLRSQGRLVEVLLGVQAEQAALCLRLDERLDGEPERFRWHQLANRWVYPNLWRPAKGIHLRMLWAEHPELRPQLRSLPQARACAKKGLATWRKQAP